MIELTAKQLALMTLPEISVFCTYKNRLPNEIIVGDKTYLLTVNETWPSIISLMYVIPFNTQSTSPDPRDKILHSTDFSHSNKIGYHMQQLYNWMVENKYLAKN